MCVKTIKHKVMSANVAVVRLLRAKCEKLASMERTMSKVQLILSEQLNVFEEDIDVFLESTDD